MPDTPDLFASAGKRARQPSATYSAKDIEVLEGLEPVRHHPAMYIGGSRGSRANFQRIRNRRTITGLTLTMITPGHAQLAQSITIRDFESTQPAQDMES